MHREVSDDAIIFAPEEPEDHEKQGDPWKIIVADDDQSVHAITEMLIRDISYRGRGIRVLSAYSGREAVDMVKNNSDAALIILDVVMEDESAGLETVKIIREELNNQLIRIILRTGHPYSVPEQNIILEYDINDYKTKTELTAEKLHTALISSLRSFSDLYSLERSKSALLRMVYGFWYVLQQDEIGQFIEGILDQLTALFSLNDVLVSIQSFAENGRNEHIFITGSGIYEDANIDNVDNVIPGETMARIKKALLDQKSDFISGEYFASTPSSGGGKRVLYFKSAQEVPRRDIVMLQLFLDNILVAFDIFCTQEIRFKDEHSINKYLSCLTENMESIVEHCVIKPSKEKLIVNELVDIIISEAKIRTENRVEVILALYLLPFKNSASQDIRESELLKNRYCISKKTAGFIHHDIRRAVEVLGEMHENWDGTGKPYKLRGEEISLSARIVRIISDIYFIFGEDSGKARDISGNIEEHFNQSKAKEYDPKLAEIVVGKSEQIKLALLKYS